MHSSYQQLQNIFLRAAFESKFKATTICHITKRLAGHSKWSNIKHTKMEKDQNKSLLFQKMCKKITQAAKEGGENPNINFKLKSLIEECKKLSIPNSTIQNAIKNASTSCLDKPYWLLYSSPSGAMVAFEVITGNAAHVSAKLNQICKKAGFKIQKNYQDYYVEKGIIVSEAIYNEDCYDKAVEDAILIGAQEVTYCDNNVLVFECLPTYVEQANKKLLDIGYKIQSATTEIEFTNYIKCNEEENKMFSSVLEKVQSQIDDVTRIVNNFNQN